MATIYVDVSHGDDANDGSSWALAKATLPAAITAATSGDTILMAPGYYQNTGDITVDKALTIQADQRRLTTIRMDNANIGLDVTGGPTTLQGLVISSSNQAVRWSAELTVDDCFVFSYSYCIVGYSSTSANPKLVIKNTILKHPYRVEKAIGNFSQGDIIGCTFYSYNRLIEMRNEGGKDIQIMNNIFYSLGTGQGGSTELIQGTQSPNLLAVDYNVYQPAISTSFKVILENVAYTTLADLQAAGYELQGLEQDPQFGDAANDVFHIPINSALLTNGSGGARRGAETGGQTYSANADTSWSTWTGTNCTYVGGVWALDNGVASGTVLSPVIDLGAQYQITGASFKADMTFPTNIVDTTNPDTTPPENLTIEIRGDTTTFNSDPSVTPPNWQEVNLNDVSTVLGTWQYVQVRLTLRSDGA